MTITCPRHILIYLVSGTAVMLGLPSVPVVNATSPAAPLVLQGGYLRTQSDQGDLVGDVLIRDGKIEAVGVEIKPPENARRIDVSGCVVTPGLIDARSTLWLTAAARREAASDGRLNILDGVDPLAEDWREVARQGITAVYVQPSGNLGGQGAVLAVAPSRSVDELVICAPAGAQASLGIDGSSSTSRARYSQYDRLKKAFEAAQKYGEQKRKFAEYQAQQKKSAEAKKKGTKEANKPKDGATKNNDGKQDDGKQAGSDTKAPSSAKAASTAKPPTEPTPDPAKEFLLKVLAGDVPVRMEAHREDDVAHALKLADEFKFRIVLEGISHPRSQHRSLLERRSLLVLGPVVQLESTPAYRRRRGDDWLTSLTSEGRRWALATFGEQPRASRLLRVHAAAAVARGAERASVLRAMTTDAAAVLGVDQDLGSLAVGKRADLAVFSGDPLEPATPVRLTLSAGQVVYEANAERPGREVVAERDAIELDLLPAELPARYAVHSTRVLRGGQWKPGRLLIRNGKLTPWKIDKKLPAGTPLYDLGSACITPGFLIAHGSLGAAPLIDDPSEADASHLRAADAYDPEDPGVEALLQAGYLRLGFAPGNVNVVAGAVSRVRIGAANPIQGSPCAVKFVLADSARNSERYPASLAGQVALIHDVLENKGLPTQRFAPAAIRQAHRDDKQQRLAAVLRRRTTALFEAATATEVRAAIQIIEKFKLRAALVNPDDIRPFIDDLVRLKVGVVARPVRVGDYDHYLDGLVQASRAGVNVAFGSAMDPLSTGAIDARLTAALAMNAGLTPEAAMAGLTTGGAKLLGMPNHTCALVGGAPADFVIWDGMPLNVSCRPKYVVIDGKMAFAGKKAADDKMRKLASVMPAAAAE